MAPADVVEKLRRRSGPRPKADGLQFFVCVRAGHL